MSGGTPINEASAAAMPERRASGRSRLRRLATAPMDSACPVTSRPHRSKMAAVVRTAIAIEVTCAASLAYRRHPPTVSIASEWFFGNGSYGVPGGTSADTSDIFAQTPRFERVEDYRSASGQVSVVAAPWQRFNVRAWVYRNRAARRPRAVRRCDVFRRWTIRSVQGTFQSRERTTVTGSSALARLDLERFGWLRVAVNQRREAFDSNGVIRDVADEWFVRWWRRWWRRGGGAGAVPPTFDVRSFAIDRSCGCLFHWC